MVDRPDWVRRVNAMGPSVGTAADMVPIDADDLVATACRTTGLDDFGPDTWEEPFRRLVRALDDEGGLHVVGRLLCRHDLLRHLRTRLQVVDACRREPAIGDEEVVAPVVVTGPARSGTSILQELLAQDPALRAPLAWEMAFPLGVDGDPVALAEPEFDLWSDVSPAFRAVHELDARLPEECLWLLAPEFDLGFWATCTQLPEWMAWRAGTDATPAYRFHRTMLQVLQHRGSHRARPWALKSPVHLGRLDVLFAVYPDARVILTHRDPVKVVTSSASTLLAGRSIRSDAVDPTLTGLMAGVGMTMLLNGVADARAAGTLPWDRVVDLHYLDLLRDPVGAIRGAYDGLGLPAGPELGDRIRAYLAARPQDKHGVHRYEAADFGLDPDQIRADLAPYTDRFGVEPEV